MSEHTGVTGTVPTVAEEPPDGAEIVALLAQADAFSAALYPSEGRHPVDLDGLRAPHVRFFVARSGGRALGCCALVALSADEAELKRMIVGAKARGRGVGRALLAVVERAARDTGIGRILLETGPRNTGALALYRRAGYRARGPFGAYEASPHSLFMEKTLGRAPEPGARTET